MKRCGLCINLFVVLLTLGSAAAWADGTLTHLSGTVSVLKLDGRTQPGIVGGRALVGETVITGAGGYVRLEMTDGSEIVLRPDSQLKVESYKFEPTRPAEDSFVLSVLKGGLRTVTGLIGKRGNRDAYRMQTATATIGIRGTQFDLRVCQANCGALPDGTYLAVRFGGVQVSNAQGALAIDAGKVAHVAPRHPPVILPRDPGIGFTPPPVIPKLDERKKQAALNAAGSTEQTKQTQAQTGSGNRGARTTEGATKPGSGGNTEGSGDTEGGSKKKSGGSKAEPGHEAGDPASTEGPGSTEGGMKKKLGPKTESSVRGDVASRSEDDSKIDDSKGRTTKPTGKEAVADDAKPKSVDPLASAISSGTATSREVASGQECSLQ